jgi:hypothetical protein
VLAVVVFGAIRYIGKEAARREGVAADTTVVAPAEGDTTSFNTGEDTASTDEGTPSDEEAGDSAEPDERPGLKEIRPVPEDSTF